MLNMLRPPLHVRAKQNQVTINVKHTTKPFTRIKAFRNFKKKITWILYHSFLIHQRHTCLFEKKDAFKRKTYFLTKIQGEPLLKIAMLSREEASPVKIRKETREPFGCGKHQFPPLLPPFPCISCLFLCHTGFIRIDQRSNKSRTCEL